MMCDIVLSQYTFKNSFKDRKWSLNHLKHETMVGPSLCVQVISEEEATYRQLAKSVGRSLW